jgi:hypothetical protein
MAVGRVVVARRKWVRVVVVVMRWQTWSLFGPAFAGK